jgi:hypothetical protein
MDNKDKLKLVCIIVGIVLLVIAFLSVMNFESKEQVFLDEPSYVYCVGNNCFVCPSEVCSSSCLRVDIYKTGVGLWR